jgi:hypothetical protein|tara:strand:+ start:2364 stop:2747 length:384 start_codon:yes stop_codon:yes gene_type:complete
MLNLLGPVAGAVFKTIDKVVDNKGEADKLKAKVQEKIIAGELAELEGAAKTIQIEAQGGFLQRNWRPIMMLVFAGLMVAHWFGFTAPNIPESVQNSLLNIILVGIGGYTVGRSAEKVAGKFKDSKKG